MRRQTMRTMLPLIASAFVFGLLAITTPLTGVAGKPMDETAFKQLIVESSPWSVRWNSSFYDGTFKINFADAGDGNFTGKLFDNSGGRSDGALSNIVIHDNRCVSFLSHTDTKHDICLEENGTFTGTLLFTSNIGETFEGTTVFLPRGR